MSEHLNNNHHKQQVLKGLIKDLHGGRDFDEVKREFGNLIKEIDATEIAHMEQQLISEGMSPDEIKKMCDVHAAVFRETLMKNEQPQLIPGHPLHTLKHENDEARKTLESMGKKLDTLAGAADRDQAASALDSLREELKRFSHNLDKHFSKKENVFFPYLEKRNITGPPSVMWSVDDEIRSMIKNLSVFLGGLQPGSGREAFGEAVKSFAGMKEKTTEMFFKEENILSPMMINALSEEEWAEIKEHSTDEFGVIFSDPGPGRWRPQFVYKAQTSPRTDGGAIDLDTGSLTPAEINAILTNLPVDVTFVDKNDEVRYFSQGKDRIFTRTKSIIGRKVQNCHPPESVHMVDKIVTDFKTGKHSHAEFWLELNGRFIHILYTALRDDRGEYLGAMEVTQDLTGPRALQGERRLLQYNDERH